MRNAAVHSRGCNLHVCWDETVAFLILGTQTLREAVPYSFGCVMHVKGHGFLQPLFICSWGAVVFPCHVMVVQSNRYRDGGNLCSKWGQNRWAQCPISHPHVPQHPSPLMPAITPFRDRPSRGFPIDPSDPHKHCLMHVVQATLWSTAPPSWSPWPCSSGTNQTQRFSETLIIQVKCFCNLHEHQEKAFLFICHCWQKINKMLNVRIKHDALPALVSGVTPHPLPHVPHPHVRKIVCVSFDLFSPFPYYLLLVQTSYSTAHAPSCSIFIRVFCYCRRWLVT